MTDIYLLRHGEADYGPVRERQWPGSMADLAPLSPRGVRQAIAAAQQLADVGAAKLVCSPFSRTLQTAGIVACRAGLLAEVEFDLHEWRPDDTFGWQTHAEVREFLADFERNGGEWPPGEIRPWEPLSAVRRRAAAALRHALGTMTGDGALIAICHEMIIRSLTGETETATGTWRLLDSGQLP